MMRIDFGEGRKWPNAIAMILSTMGMLFIWNASNVDSVFLPAIVLLCTVVGIVVFYKWIVRNTPPEDRSSTLVTGQNTLILLCAWGVASASLGHLLSVIIG